MSLLTFSLSCSIYIYTYKYLNNDLRDTQVKTAKILNQRPCPTQYVY